MKVDKLNGDPMDVDFKGSSGIKTSLANIVDYNYTFTKFSNGLLLIYIYDINTIGATIEAAVNDRTELRFYVTLPDVKPFNLINKIIYTGCNDPSFENDRYGVGGKFIDRFYIYNMSRRRILFSICMPDDKDIASFSNFKFKSNGYIFIVATWK